MGSSSIRPHLGIDNASAESLLSAAILLMKMGVVPTPAGHQLTRRIELGANCYAASAVPPRSILTTR